MHWVAEHQLSMCKRPLKLGAGFTIAVAPNYLGPKSAGHRPSGAMENDLAPRTFCHVDHFDSFDRFCDRLDLLTMGTLAAKKRRELKEYLYCILALPRLSGQLEGAANLCQSILPQC
eukprot:s18_g16.t1